jgi:hypothetical protein
MTALSLRLQKSMAAVPAEAGVVATVRPLGEVPAPSRSRTVTIPVGSGTPATLVDVPPGRYLVQAYLPSGDIVSQDVDVQGPVEVELSGEHSPHEWLSYQHLLGNVTNKTTFGRPAHDVLEPYPEVFSLDFPLIPLNLPGNDDVWRLLGDSIAGLLSPFQLAPVHRPLVPAYSDDNVRLFQVPSNGITPVNEVPMLDTGRCLVLVADQQAARMTLVALPFPWRDVLTDASCWAEVLVERGGSPADRRVSVSVQDTMVSTVLGYLGSGAFTTAQEIVQPAMWVLMSKLRNPLAAAAGGYVLVGSSTEPITPWDQWLDNLTNWFPWLPDGPVIRSRLLLRLARDEGDIAMAHASLKMAFQRGLPFYGLGLQWLVDGLTVFAADDREAAFMLDMVRPVARRCNLQQPFTVLDLVRP